MNAPPDLEVGLVARLIDQGIEDVSAVLDDRRPMIVVDTTPGGRALVQGAVWQHTVQLAAWGTTRDDAWDLIRAGYDAVITPPMATGWTAGELDVSSCMSINDPFYLPDPVSGDPRCITTVQLTYRSTI